MRTPLLDRRQFALCCLTVLAALLPHASWLPRPLLVLLLGLLALRWLQRERWPRPWPWWFRNGLMLLLFAAAWSSIGTISGTQGAGFLAAMLVSKLYEAERVRDARSIATFASFLVMAQFLFETQLWSMLAGAPGVLLALATLASLEQAHRPGPVAVAPALGRAGLLLAAALPLALALFVAFPRIASPLWGNAAAAQRGGMGLSDRMEPGQIGLLAQDDRPAMRVRFDGALPPVALRYFRGLTLWATDGRAWTRPDWVDTRLDELPAALERGIRHEITLEPDAAPWLPVLERPVAAPEGLRLALDHSLPLSRRNRALRYQVLSDPDLVLEPFGLAPQARALALALPADRNPRTVALARELRTRHADPAAYASALLQVFADRFVYSLEPPPLGLNAVDDFLFGTRAGYCEHYASAYATLLRAGGVPARVVLGYHGGYFNAVGGHLVVRRSDAHAWVELWVEGRGWLRADPTGMVAPERIEGGGDALAALADNFGRSGLGRWLRDRWDFLDLRWTDWIVNFRSESRSALFERLADWLPRDGRALLRFALVAALALALVAAALWLLRRAPLTRPRERLDPAGRWLAAHRRLLAAAGVAAPDSEPLAALLARAGRRYPALAGPLGEPALRCQAVRYGGSGQALPGLATLAGLWWRLRVARLRQALSGAGRSRQPAADGEPPGS